jgi:hypothetical protein
MSKFEKGHQRVSAAGRKPGVRNKFVTELKEAFLQAAEDVGEVDPGH